MTTNSHDIRYRNLCDEYRKLSEPNKRQLVEIIHKHQPGVFESWFKMSNVKGFAHAKAVIGRPGATGKSLDDSLLKSGMGTLVTRIYFENSAYSGWLDWLLKKLSGVPKSELVRETLTAIFSEVTPEKSDAPFFHHDLRSYFQAYCLVDSQRLIKIAREQKANRAKLETTPALAASTADDSRANAGEELDLTKLDLQGYEALLKSIEGEMEAARNLQIFDAEKLASDVAKLGINRESLIGRLEKGAAQLGESPPSIDSIATYRVKLTEIESRLQAKASGALLRERLGRLIAPLQSLEDIGSRSAKRREAIAEAKLQAEKELAAAQNTTPPPALPGDEDGVAWLQATFALTPKELERRSAELIERSLVRLADFIAEADRWDIFTVKATPLPSIQTEPLSPAEPAAPPVAPPQTAIAEIAPQPPTAAEVTPTSVINVPKESVSVAPTLTTPPATTRKPVDPIEPAVVVGPVTREVVPQAVTPPAPVPTIAPTPDTTVPKSTDVQGGSSAPTIAVPKSEFPEVLLGFSKSAAGRCLIRDAAHAWSDQPELINLPRQIWELLHVQPVLLSPASTEANQAAQWLRELEEWTPHNATEAMISWAAVIVPAFVGAANGAYPILHTIRDQLPVGPIRELTHETLGLFERVPGCSAESIRSGSLYERWDQLAQVQRKSLLDACDSARLRKINYQKATRIWLRLNGPEGRLRKLALLAQKAATVGEVESLNRPLLQANERDRLIDALTREVVDGRVIEIEGKARQQLHTCIEEFAGLVQQHLQHLSNQPKDQNYITGQLQSFLRKANPAVEAICQLGDTNGWSGVAIHFVRNAANALRELLRATPTISAQSESLSDTTWIARLCLPALDVEASTGEIESSAAEHLRATLRVENFQSPLEATQSRIMAGDFGNAQRLLSNVQAVDDRDRLAESLNAARTVWLGRVDAGMRQLKSRVVNARALLVVNEMEAQGYLTQLASLEHELKDNQNYGSVLRRMAAVGAGLDERMVTEAQLLRDKLSRNRQVDPAVTERMERLLERNDLATVREYFNLIESNKALPQVYTDETEKRFGQQQEEAIRNGFGAGGGFDGLIVALRNKQAFAGFDFANLGTEPHGEILRWLEKGWQALKRNRHDAESVKSWFQGLGFSAKTVVQRDGFFEVTTEPITERELCPIPSYGSLANGGYSVSVFPGPTDPAQMLPARDTASIVLALYPLAPGVRQQFARHCRDKRKRALLVDDCLMAFLARHGQGRMRSFFRATFPFTWIDPYLPTTSLVPPELFFGRTKALDALLDFDKQRCFVYGGRQLGKTALLREVERRAHHPEQETYAIWIDLQSLEFGRQTEPKEIWGKLEPELRRKLLGFDTIFGKTARGAQPSTRLTTALLNWVHAAPQRKLLLLLDEGDSFLDSDSANDFTETRKLKGLMDDSKRCIKVVFAGLHNVQRSTTQPNHPLAHLGEAIQIGAFSAHEEWMEAYSLVVGPLAALGYTFESMDLPSRVLTACNFYPGLIQQFGHRLLDRLRTRSRNDWPCEISADDVDTVANDDELRRFMIDRFHLTLQLDLRYHYLAYLFALRFHENKQVAVEGLNCDELKNLATNERPDVFGNPTREAFATLIEEMVGLGIFLAEPTRGRVFLRNTNILLFLGSKSQILTALIEDLQEVRYDYKAETCRGKGFARDQANRRRWLTRVEENKLFEPSGQLAYLSALPIAQSSSITDTLRAAAGSLTAGSFTDFRFTLAKDLDAKLKNLSERDASEGLNLVLVRPNSWLHYEEVHQVASEFVKRTRKVKFYSLIVEVPTEFAFSAEGSVFLARKDVTQYCARRWEREFIGPWLQECGLTATHQQLDALMNLTDGWPEFLHSFIRQHETSHNWERAVEQTQQAVDLRFREPGKFAIAALGFTPSKHPFLDLLSDLSDKGAVAFSSADCEAAVEMHGISAQTISCGLIQAARHGLLVSNDSRHRCTPLFSRMLAAL